MDGLAPDIMHDVLEGTTQLTLKCLMRHLICEQKFFSFSTLNERISSFHYSFAELSNKPSEVSRASFLASDTLRQSGKIRWTVRTCYYTSCLATQAWCLARFFPLLVGDMVPECDAKWKSFLLLLRIMELTFAPVTTINNTYYLEMLIEEFLSDFNLLYPARTITPKMHYLVHVPSWTRK